MVESTSQECARPLPLLDPTPPRDASKKLSMLVDYSSDSSLVDDNPTNGNPVQSDADDQDHPAISARQDQGNPTLDGIHDEERSDDGILPLDEIVEGHFSGQDNFPGSPHAQSPEELYHSDENASSSSHGSGSDFEDSNQPEPPSPSAPSPTEELFRRPDTPTNGKEDLEGNDGPAHPQASPEGNVQVRNHRFGIKTTHILPTGPVTRPPPTVQRLSSPTLDEMQALADYAMEVGKGLFNRRVKRAEDSKETIASKLLEHRESTTDPSQSSNPTAPQMDLQPSQHEQPEASSSTSSNLQPSTSSKGRGRPSTSSGPASQLLGESHLRASSYTHADIISRFSQKPRSTGCPYRP
jgi:hypothetical protein